MIKTIIHFLRRFWVCALWSLACMACGDGEIAELGIYDELIHAAKHKRDARVDPGPPAKDAGADPMADASTKDAGKQDTTGPKPVDASAQDETLSTADASPPSRGGSGGASVVPIAYDDPDLKCYRLNAFAPSARSNPYIVPTNPDYYVAFHLKAPWTGKQYVRSFKSLADNKAVLVEMLLFKQAAGGVEQVRENALGAHPDDQLLYSWAPGADDLYFDADVGMEVDGSLLYQLEVHYNNEGGRPVSDASGFELCVTPKVPEHVAGLSWLGTDYISGSSAQGRCAPQSTAPIHLIAGLPRMRVKGKHMKVELTRGSGAKEIVHDEDFAWDYQRSYLLNVDMQPGEVLNTTCTYTGDATFGKAVSDEVCYFYAIHRPAGALTSTSVATIIHGVNSCIEL